MARPAKSIRQPRPPGQISNPHLRGCGKSLVLCPQPAELLKCRVRVQVHVAWVEEISRQRRPTTGAPANRGDAYVDIPISQDRETGIEAPRLFEERTLDHHTRRRAYHVHAEKRPLQPQRGCGERYLIPDSVVSRQNEAGVGEGCTFGCASMKLRSQLRGRPEVVVVEKCDPLPPSFLDPPVTGPRDPDGAIVSQVDNALVGSRRQFGCGIRRSVVNDHNLNFDVLLSQDGRERPGKQRPPITSRDHDGDELSDLGRG